MRKTALALILQISASASAGAASDVPSLYRAYVRAGQNSLLARLQMSRIERALAAEALTPAYVDDLKFLDAQASSDPEPGYDLAKFLELRWEAKYGSEIDNAQSNSLKAGGEVGAIVGISLLGLALFKQPAAAPRYFALVRHLLPLAGAGSGVAIGGVSSAKDSVPPAPAAVMNFGRETASRAPMENEEVEDLVAMSSGVAASSMAMEVIAGLRIANAAATPFKFDPAVLVGSIAVGYGSEALARALMDYQAHQAEVTALMNAVALFDAALDKKDDLALFKAADALEQNAIALANEMNRPLNDALKDYNAQLASANPGDPRVRDAKFRRRILALKLPAVDANFAAGISKADDLRLANDLRAGALTRDSDHVLYEVSALIRSSGKDYLTYESDELISLIRHTQSLRVWAQSTGDRP